jgi:hypothetical protein
VLGARLFGTTIQGVRNDMVDAVGVMHDVVIGEPQHRVPLSTEEGVAPCIPPLRYLCEMRVAVDLDDELGVVAGKIDDERANLRLLAEVVAAGSKRIEYPPHAPLGRR